MDTSNPRRDLATTTLGVLSICGLIYLSYLIMLPLLAAIIWAALIVVASWPIMLKVQARLRNSRAWAATVMTASLVLVLVLPMIMAATTIANHSVQIVEWAKALPNFQFPPLPARIANLPLMGGTIAAGWQQLQSLGIQELVVKLGPHAEQIAKWVLSGFGKVGVLMVQLILTVAIAAVMYSGGETAARATRRFSRRLAGERGEEMVVLSAQAVRSVALGVGVTAIVQTVLGGIGLAIAGVPYAELLTIVMLVLCIAQVGPSPVLFLAVAWVYWTGHDGWGTFLLIWSTVVSLMDNVIRPMLVRMGADLPALLILAGVIGGMAAFGLIGIFIGPVVLAVVYTLLESWMAEGEEPETEKPA